MFIARDSDLFPQKYHLCDLYLTNNHLFFIIPVNKEIKAMEKTEQGDFVEILKKALAEMPEGKIDFRGPTEGFVSVIFIDGDILLIDSTWGAGNDQLQRIYDWKTGTCVIKDLASEEKKALETQWQKPVILDEVKKETREAISLEHPVAVKPLLRDLKWESLDLDAFLAEIQEMKYSGEARTTTQLGHNQILFYQGLPLITSDHRSIAMQEVREIMSTPEATLNFYLLGDELARACFSVMQGEKVWQGLSVTVLHLDKMLNKLMEKNPTGHLCIHKEQGDRHYCFFSQGTPLGVYEIEQHWKPVDISTLWEGAKQVDYYLSAEIESFLSKAEEISSSEDFKEFIVLWNDLVAGLAKKMGKKPVEKSLQKKFGRWGVYALQGIRLQPASEHVSSGYDALETFKLNVPGFLKEMETLSGSHWLIKQLQAFQEKNGDIIARLSLNEVFSRKGG
jgi:hypothetical protein